ncbi:hypothetical protein CTEN210_15958 [Chaetoceros tenuissimus]|uniref:Circumsporozoite protein n=1 Tax=Chaetoceros tenuissimus TaxID=426638 RepID=A0AAD3D8P8_9STRA|nr:hypothetical protein CTEN210_15958 [Chaetoceros tenuissimus]
MQAFGNNRELQHQAEDDLSVFQGLLEQHALEMKEYFREENEKIKRRLKAKNKRVKGKTGEERESFVVKSRGLENTNEVDRSTMMDNPSHQDDTYTLMMISSQAFLWHWILGFLVFATQFGLGTLTIYTQLKTSEKGTFLQIPIHTDIEVTILQVFSIFIEVYSQEDIFNAIGLLLNSRRIPLERLRAGDSKEEVRVSFMLHVLLPNIFNFLQGMSVLIASFIVILQGTEFIELMRAVTALFVISSLDDIVFSMARRGFFGRKVLLLTVAATNVDLSVQDGENHEKSSNDGALKTTLLHTILLFMISFWAVVLYLQSGGFFAKQKYPECEDVVLSFNEDWKLLENGVCNIALNHPECGFDDNDCVKFNRAYPGCVVEDIYLLGNGICNGHPYESVECKFDGGDCSFESNSPSMDSYVELSMNPSFQVSHSPSTILTKEPVSNMPSVKESHLPSKDPEVPSTFTSMRPSYLPSVLPSSQPSLSNPSSNMPSPSSQESQFPSVFESDQPSQVSSKEPSHNPSASLITCIASIADIQYEDKTDNQFMTCETPNGNSYKVKAVDNDFIKKNFGSGKLMFGEVEITFDADAVIDESTAEIISNFPPALAKKTKKNDNNSNGRKLQTVANCGTYLGGSCTGTRTVLVVRVIAADKSTTASESQLAESIFDNPNDALNLQSWYKQCSYNQLDLIPAEGNGINGGVTTVSVQSSSTDGDSVMNNDIFAALNAKFNVSSPKQIANHIMYCLPAGTMSGIAYANINNWRSVYSDNWCTFVSAQGESWGRPVHFMRNTIHRTFAFSLAVREIGHNLMLANSKDTAAIGSSATYGDQSGMMGFSYSSDDGPRQCFNAPKNWQLGWFDDKQISVSFEGWEGNLVGLSEIDNAAEEDTVIAKVDTNESYYVSFNRKTGINSGTIEGGNKVLVHKRASGFGYGESDILAYLNSGETYTSPDTNFFVTVNNIDLTSNPARANVKILRSDNPPPCYAGTASVSITPDNYSDETSWDIRDYAANVIASGGSTGVSNILLPDGYYTFSIYDSYGDGICCTHGNGSYTFQIGSAIVKTGGEFGSQESTQFGICNNASPTAAPANEISSNIPSEQPTQFPSMDSEAPSTHSSLRPPSSQPSLLLSNFPTIASAIPSSHSPSKIPSEDPSILNSMEPSNTASRSPSNVPSNKPSQMYSKEPSLSPSVKPTKNPTSSPTASSPTLAPSPFLPTPCIDDPTHIFIAPWNPDPVQDCEYIAKKICIRGEKFCDTSSESFISNQRYKCCATCSLYDSECVDCTDTIGTPITLKWDPTGSTKKECSWLTKTNKAIRQANYCLGDGSTYDVSDSCCASCNPSSSPTETPTFSPIETPTFPPTETPTFPPTETPTNL